MIIPGGNSPQDIRAALGHFRDGRAARPGGTSAERAEVVVFVTVRADSPATDIAAVVGEYAAAGATHIAVNAAEDDADLERFVAFLALEVAPLVS